MCRMVENGHRAAVDAWRLKDSSLAIFYPSPATYVLGFANNCVCAYRRADQSSDAYNDPDVCNTQYCEHEDGHADEDACTKETVHFIEPILLGNSWDFSPSPSRANI